MTREEAVQIAAGRTLPLWAIRVAGVAVAAASFVVLPLPYALLVVGLAAVGAIVPATFTTWAAIVVLAFAQLAQPLAVDARAVVLVAVVHLLHVIGGLQLALPPTGRIRLRALAAPARRWLAVQVPAQVGLLLALAATRVPLRGLLPAGVVAVGASVCVVIMVVLVRLLSARR